MLDLNYKKINTADEVIRNMRLLDDELMQKVFDENREAAELILNIILDKDDLQIQNIQIQKRLNSPVQNGKDLIIDIWAEDTGKNIYNIEIQRNIEGADRRRARYHSSVIDSRMLEKSKPFRVMPDSFVIFITETDVLKNGMALSHVERMVFENGDRFDDGNHIIYVNCGSTESKTEVGKLIHDFKCRNTEDMYYKTLKRAVDHFKDLEGAGGEMSQIVEMYGEKKRAEGRAEGKAEGIAEGKAEGIAEGKAKGIAEGKAEGIAEGKAEGIAEGKAEGIAEGKAEGRTEGRAEGKIEGRRILFNQLLAKHMITPEQIKVLEIENEAR